jgi:2-amino-4-hydroxy-6-hydroxymethyldihydropteridine diphosphokinase
MILVALGSNITGPWGTPKHTLRHAIAVMPGYNIRVLMTSRFLVTAPYGVENQPDFVNAVVSVATELTPSKLMATLHEIERKAGRKRELRWGPRTLDLDLLDYNGMIVESAGNESKLSLPHPGIAERSFVLKPLLEIASDWTHPVTGLTAANILKALKTD